MPETLIKVDLTKSAYENDMVHNRWHPDIPIVAWVNPGDDFIIETYDWTGGFIKNRSVLVIEHDMKFVEDIAHKVTVLHQGQILSEGTMEKVKNDPKVIEVYLGH